MPAQTIKAGYANVSPFHAIKLVAMATSLDRNSPNFLAVVIVSSTVLTQHSRCNPSTRCRITGATLQKKKKITPAKHKRAAGIAGGLISGK